MLQFSRAEQILHVEQLLKQGSMVDHHKYMQVMLKACEDMKSTPLVVFT